VVTDSVLPAGQANRAAGVDQPIDLDRTGAAAGACDWRWAGDASSVGE
jgi:hypothetical protein